MEISRFCQLSVERAFDVDEDFYFKVHGLVLGVHVELVENQETETFSGNLNHFLAFLFSSISHESIFKFNLTTVNGKSKVSEAQPFDRVSNLTT